MPVDPFLHHPELRPLIDPPESSPMRFITNASVSAELAARGLGSDWMHDDAGREANRRRFLERHRRDGHAGAGQGGALWVFAYGSLMWNPAILFDEVRRAHLRGYARRFILRDNQGGRGTPEAPGLMAALDHDPAGCDGLAFRIPAPRVEHETRILWQREMIGPGYIPVMAQATTAQGRVACCTFVADHAAPLIEPALTRSDQIRYLATGAGFLGTSMDYLRRIARQFSALGIEDHEVTSLLAEAEAAL